MKTLVEKAPVFPGGTSVTRLSVYADQAPDGVAGGTPHLHTASTEAYVVLSGRGAIQTISPEGFRETTLEPGSVVWFTPGTIHRAVNHGDLEILVIMSNAGLPEAGDAVMTFPEDIVSDPEAYRVNAALPPADSPESVLSAAAARRRDLGVDGFLALKAAADTGPQAFEVALDRFYSAASAVVTPLTGTWREVWEKSAGRAASETDQVLSALVTGSQEHLWQAALEQAPATRANQRFGMCGRLQTYNTR
ncbi:cupin domain-containing protein [Pseudarthrobacter sp. NamE2]|uniref:cupin domain-containing protein n=1 Tax=Pseudarthrobacter sp. NamE2 TaxID=2576838 RepID=UPI0010FEBF08|nr:cupin domain-containing protein [Pseudarthrobacter sp. NamE2]TLM83579.1 cupin domain-containing protein [Pseudarthrobacter sp. NamE2]